ncbi:hypothetical protein K3495_g14238 [Podosphaera aphanis]|nr:hypothetical protein K3495_g14238 [Podosphaera aphanis]
MGFKSLEFDKNVFRYKETLISTYVDDFMIISESELQTHQTAGALGNAFWVKDLGTMTKFLGINIEQDCDGIRINQQDKIEVLCEDMKMDNCKGANTPVADDNLIDCDIENSCSKDDAALYRSAVGTLLNIANMTRPDIQYAAKRLCRYVRNPSTNAMSSLKHLIRYTSRTKSASLFFSR